MEHQNHSNGNSNLHHQKSFTTTTSPPSFRVYVDMGTEQYANGSVVYTSEQDVDRTCIDHLKDDAHYRFGCRCGCGASFAGYGKDIKAASKLGRSLVPAPVNGTTVTTNGGETMASLTDDFKKTIKATKDSKPLEIKGEPRQLDAQWSLENAQDIASQHGVLLTPAQHAMVDHTSVPMALTPEQIADLEIKNNRADLANKLRPFVPDRYLKKALFDLTDDEIDALEENTPLSGRQPPAIGDSVYSIATCEGPFTLLEQVSKNIKDSDGVEHRVLCGLLRTKRGKLRTIPLADLDTHAWDWSDDGTKVSWVKRLAAVSLVSAISSMATIAGYFYFF